MMGLDKDAVKLIKLGAQRIINVSAATPAVYIVIDVIKLINVLFVLVVML
jgi:hypothetical protein